MLSGCTAIFMLVARADLRRGAKLAVGANAVADARAAARITGRIMLSVETRKQQFQEMGKNNQNASTELPQQHRKKYKLKLSTSNFTLAAALPHYQKVREKSILISSMHRSEDTDCT